jgi:hypothetical protein
MQDFPVGALRRMVQLPLDDANSSKSCPVGVIPEPTYTSSNCCRRMLTILARWSQGA